MVDTYYCIYGNVESVMYIKEYLFVSEIKYITAKYDVTQTN